MVQIQMKNTVSGMGLKIPLKAKGPIVLGDLALQPGERGGVMIRFPPFIHECVHDDPDHGNRSGVVGLDR